MTRKLSSHLKIHVEEPVSSEKGKSNSLVNIDAGELLQAFAQATGWMPRPASSTPHAELPLKHPHTPALDSVPMLPLRKRVKLVSATPIDGMLEAEAQLVTSEEEAWQLLEHIDRLIQELNLAEGVIAVQETQLATAVGVSIRKDEAELLSARLRESLQRAAEQTGSDAAAIYLLDDATSELKMRCCWGLPTPALAAPARSLRGALADLEALMGNAVLIENTKLAPEWNCPEDFAAAFCLPIGSPTMPQGTLWLWSEHIRDFGTTDIEVAKAAADKILVDIERSILADEVLKTRGLDRQIEAASMVQSSRLPTAQPLHQDYDIAGWTFQGQALGGNFHTWTFNRNEQICAALGSAATTGACGALVATSIQTVVETCWNSRHRPKQVLRRANDILWDVQDGDWRASLCYLQIHPASGSTQISLGGRLEAFVVSNRGIRTIGGTATYLAEQPDTRFFDEQLYLEGGDLLVIASESVLAGDSRGGLTQQSLLETIRDMREDAVGDIVDHLARMLPMETSSEAQARTPSDRSLLIVRRRF
ncbi:MAG: SpoIIE family protein phosphatase [bacterium]|nr:SpoIIE family protein phosphatase [bacterium]